MEDCVKDGSYLAGKASLLDYHLAGRYQVVPVDPGADLPVVLLTPAAQDPDWQRQLRFVLRREVRMVRVSMAEYARLVNATWQGADRQGNSDEHTERFTASVGNASVVSVLRTDLDLEQVVGGVTVAELVDRILSRAVTRGASDIHFEPAGDELKVRYRMDGVLHPVLAIDQVRQLEVISRLKILANMDIAEKRRPQDGRIVLTGAQKNVDVRVSAMPTPHGEKMVLRILDKSRQPLDLAALGIDGENLELFRDAIAKPDGMILVTGPTGSGKTTTLYAALNTILTPQINISTVEDPIEYLLAGVNQTQVHAEIGYTFAAAIRTFLRQDPDVIMVGEIRDEETAKYAIQAAQTGHLVFSTLHTNDAPSAVVRLLEMGVEPYLVASTVHLIMAQRLARRVCNACATRQPLTPAEQRYLVSNNAPLLPQTVLAGTGCKECGGSGYRGRVGLYEIMKVSPAVQELITSKASTQRIREKAIAEGMRGLQSEGVRLASSGATTVEEVRQVVG